MRLTHQQKNPSFYSSQTSQILTKLQKILTNNLNDSFAVFLLLASVYGSRSACAIDCIISWRCTRRKLFFQPCLLGFLSIGLLPHLYMYHDVNWTICPAHYGLSYMWPKVRPKEKIKSLAPMALSCGYLITTSKLPLMIFYSTIKYNYTLGLI